MVALTACASRIRSAGEGFSNLSNKLAALTLTRLPDSSSIWAELSASERMRPVWNFPASSNNAYMGAIVPCSGAVLAYGVGCKSRNANACGK